MAKIEFDFKAEIDGIRHWAGQDLKVLPGRLLETVQNFRSADNERRNPDSAFWQFAYRRGQDSSGQPALVDAITGIAMIDRMRYYSDWLGQQTNKPLMNLRQEIAVEQLGQFSGVQNSVLSLNEGEEMIFFSPCGGKVDDGLAIVKTKRKGDRFQCQSGLLPGTTEKAARSLLGDFLTDESQLINLDQQQDSVLFMAVKGQTKNIDFQGNFLEERNEFHLQRLGEEPEEIINLGACQSVSRDRVFGLTCESETQKNFSDKQMSITPITPVLPLLLAVSLPSSELSISMIQFTETEVSPTTAPHSTVVNNIPVSPVLSESASFFHVMEQNLEGTAVLESILAAEKPLFVAPVMSESLSVSTVSSVFKKTEQTSMFQIIEENSESALDNTKLAIAEEEGAQVPKIIVPSVSMIQYIDTKLAADKPLNLATVKTQAENNRPAVGYEAKEREEAWQTEDAVACPDCYSQGTVVAQGVMEQQFVFEKAVKKFSLPLLEISADTAPMMVLRAELKPVVKADETDDFKTEPMAVRENEKTVEDEVIFVDNQLQVPVEKKVIAGVDKEQGKLFLVENFSLVQGQAVKKQETQALQLKKIFWRIKTLASEPTEVSVLELELPKEQNQRLYAFYHFLQKVVKKVMGEDVIRTRQVAVISEKEAVDLDLELVDQIEYYLQLLRGRSYAQAFAFVN